MDDSASMSSVDALEELLESDVSALETSGLEDIADTGGIADEEA